MALKNLFKRDMTGVGANETTGISIYDWSKMFAPGSAVSYGGNTYQAYKITTTAGGGQFYETSPVVFACASIRMLLFSEARFQWQAMRNGRPGDLFGTAALSLLEEPEPGRTERDLLAQSETDVTDAGNSYWVKNKGYLQRLEPVKTSVLTARAMDRELSGFEIGEELLAYVYKPTNDPRTWTMYEPTEVFHYKPYPNPRNRFIGQSWLTPCLGDLATDEALTSHKQATIGNGARLSTIVSFDPSVNKEQFDAFVDTFQRQHEGPENAGKTLFLGGGADVKTVGQSFESLALQATQGASEVRIAACAGIPPVIVGFSEGLKGSSLNAGNYGQARRRLVDGTMRPLWGIFASAMQSLLVVPASSRLWYDDRDIAFCREDVADQADIFAKNAAALTSLIHGGWKPDAAVEAVTTGDMTRLSGKHTGLSSVQLVPPGDPGEPYPPIAPAGSPPPTAAPVPTKAAPPTSPPKPTNGKQPVAP